MFHKNSNTPRRSPQKTRAVLLILFTIFSLLSRAAINLGQITYSYAPAMTMEGPHLGQAQVAPNSLREALTSYSFVSSVGGVAFAGTALGKPGFKILDLQYHPERADGDRIEVIFASDAGKDLSVRAKAYDWQLAPIARFADGKSFACFTLFGRLLDGQDEKQRLIRGEKILNYHSAFVDTLLGLRLMQADILILYPDSAELASNGERMLLGAGEVSPDTQANRNRLARLHAFESSLSGGPFQSYVICDDKQEVNFGVTNGVLELTGFPLWYCWRNKTSNPQQFRQVQEEANRRANEILNQDRATLAAMSPEEQQRHFHALWDKHVSELLLQDMPVYSRELSTKIRNLDGINTAVYHALVVTMRYAAFFRHVKKEKPKEWESFLESVRSVTTTPEVQTPTVMKLPDTYQRHR